MKKLMIASAFLLVGTPSSFALVNNVNHGANEFQDLRNWRSYIQEVKESEQKASYDDLLRWRAQVSKQIKGDNQDLTEEERMNRIRKRELSNPYQPNTDQYFNWLYRSKEDIEIAQDFLNKSYKNKVRYPFTENRNENSYQENPREYLELRTNSSERMKYRLLAQRARYGWWNWNNDDAKPTWWDWTDKKNRLVQKKRIQVDSTEAE